MIKIFNASRKLAAIIALVTMQAICLTAVAAAEDNRPGLLDEAQGGVTGQVYQHGLYDVAADEALIVTIELPEQCDYWNVQTTDMLWQTHDFMRTQSSLNGHIDRADGDGLTRIVFAHRDPGAKNWIDLNDLDKGYLLMRWINCQSDREPQTELITFAELNDHLPADTTRITPRQRLLDIRKAASARHKRRYW